MKKALKVIFLIFRHILPSRIAVNALNTGNALNGINAVNAAAAGNAAKAVNVNFVNVAVNASNAVNAAYAAYAVTRNGIDATPTIVLATPTEVIVFRIVQEQSVGLRT